MSFQKTRRIAQNGSKILVNPISHDSPKKFPIRYMKFDVKQNSQGHFSHKTPPFCSEVFGVF